MVDLCKYKNALGEPRKGIHSFLYTAICLFILGIILHRLFCVRTTVDKILFPKI